MPFMVKKITKENTQQHGKEKHAFECFVFKKKNLGGMGNTECLIFFCAFCG